MLSEYGLRTSGYTRAPVTFGTNSRCGPIAPYWSLQHHERLFRGFCPSQEASLLCKRFVPRANERWYDLGGGFLECIPLYHVRLFVPQGEILVYFESLWCASKEQFTGLGECSPLPAALSFWDCASPGLYASSLLFEIVADGQNTTWRCARRNKVLEEKFITRSISRHPNHLGEVGISNGKTESGRSRPRRFRLPTIPRKPLLLAAVSPLFTYFLLRVALCAYLTCLITEYVHLTCQWGSTT
ncbi:hypothetical protein BC826DRAFT_452216 [Russula brevipes]|nr:hypothetical protein BC826DRAFT_452216 [Russula brevipes]